MSTPDDPFRKAPPAEGAGPASHDPPGAPPPAGHPSGPGYPSPPGYPPPAGYPSGPPAYGSPSGYGPGQGPQQTSTRAIVALVCAVGSFVVFPLVPAIVALVLAPGATREIEESGGRLTGEGLVTAARITAWINIGLFLLVLVVFVLAVFVFAATGVGFARSS